MAKPALRPVTLCEIKNRLGRMTVHPLYNTWRGMLERCYCHSSPTYARYGAKGVTVFEPWKNKSRHPTIKRWSLGFCLFLEYIEKELGEKPLGHSLDRINLNQGYQPGNLRWADASLQKKNQKITNKSGYKYVYSIAGSNKWQAEYKFNEQRVYVGAFKTKEEAYFAALADRLEVFWPKDL